MSTDLGGGDNGRYAIYLAPEAGSPLEGLAAAWLGRDLSGAAVAPPDLGPVATGWEALVDSPRHYGFHGTLKPPFALAKGLGEGDLLAALGQLARDLRPFTVLPLEVAVLGSFLALRPTGPEPELSALAASCVTRLDRFRAPQSEGELAKRRAKGLTERQEEMLRTWGYPYVLEEFRFHMTLTGPVTDAERRAALRAALARYFAPALGRPLSVGEIALYHQPDRARPFVLTRRFALGGGS